MKNSILLFVNFCLCYPHDFISKVWVNENEAKHLKSKFDIAYERSGTRGAIIDFFSMLDNENQKLLSSWITENYKG